MRLQIDTSPRAVSQNSSYQQSAHSSRSKTPDPTSAASGHSTFSRASSPNLLSPAPSSSSSSPIDTHPLRRYTPSPSPSLSEDGDPDYVLAMHDFTPDHRNATCLAFQAGQVIHVLNRDPSGWWDGEVDNRRGWFPSNYVATTAVAASLTEEVFPGIDSSHNGKKPSGSWSNPTSPKRTTPNGKGHRQSASESIVSDADVYCPSIMISLLHALSLLQNAIRSGRLAHFQPSTACIISCVRSILATTGCLSRDAFVLRRYPMLAEQRKRILSDLASLVSEAKIASAGNLDEMHQVVANDSLMRSGGRVFARVRRFLVFGVQCGVKLPEGDEDEGSTAGPSSVTEGRRRPSGEPLTDDGDTSNDDDNHDEDDTYRRKTPVIARTTNGIVRRPVFSRFQPTNNQSTPRPAPRTKSMGDLRNTKSASKAASPNSPPRHISPTPLRAAPPPPTHQRGPSQSSLSSLSSLSSAESVRTPATPKFPNGPCTVAEVIETLRNTHDQYLSTIAAFIGHAHSHSSTSHASSTGHMLELVREVVEMVCRLLTIVDAVMKHPGTPAPKLLNLKASKHGLYNVTSSLAESVRVLTTGTSGEERSEEDERAGLLKSATDALKAGGDCVSEVKKCLSLSVVDEPIILQLPVHTKLAPDTLGASKPPTLPSSDPQSVSKLALGIDEDATVQGDLLPLVSLQQPFPDNEVATIDDEPIPSPEVSLGGRDSACSMRSAQGHKPLPSPLTFASDPIAQTLPSPVSLTRTDDDGTTWEGSTNLHGRPSQDTTTSGRTTPRYARSEVDGRLLLSHDYSLEDVAYNKDGVLVGASLECLVEKMTPHDNIVDPAFSAVFFMTFRMFSTPQELVASVIRRYNLLPPAGLSDEDLYVWQQRKGVPVRLRVANFLKLWLETYWRSCTDDAVLGTLMAFTREALAAMFPNPSQRVMELIILRSQQTNSIISPRADRSKDAGMPLNPPSTGLNTDIPRPIMTKTLLTQLRAHSFANISALDFDALELARQLTIMESKLYCAITAEEILEAGKEAQRGAATPNPGVKAVTTLSTAITGWVAETILDEMDAKKRTALVKFFIKLADRCNTLSNFSTSRAILAALDSSTISRLQQTWTGLPQKYRLQLEGLRKLADHARNYSEYRGRLRNTSPPAVPFLGLYLTDLTFCREGNPSTRPSPTAPEKKLINFNKYHKLARIVQDMQRFQISYNLKEIPEVHEYLRFALEKSKKQGDLQDLYRRSLLIEPKQPADTPPASDVRQLFGWASRQPSTLAPTSA